MELNYRLVSANPYDTFDSAEPWRGQLGAWHLVLENSQLGATTDEPFDSDAAAKASLEPLLRDWAAAAYLRQQYEVSFVANGVEPLPAAPDARDRIFMRSSKTYPAPDPEFTLNATADQTLALLQAFVSGAKPLPQTLREVAAVMTRAAEAAGGTVGDIFKIEKEVVDEIDELVMREGNYRGPEWQWMQECLRLLTLQAGRTGISPPASRLTMSEFRTDLTIS